jgi:aminopeptidase N
MVAFAIGDYAWTSLGTTKGGTEVGFWTTPALVADATKGTATLLAACQWFETHLGPYPFGPRMGAVSTEWGPFVMGGIEQHPFWHVANPIMGDKMTHLHEAAHGWFGNSVRLACWEDLVLSEGLATYLAGRVVEVLEGPAAGKIVFSQYAGSLASLIQSGVDPVALPDSCGELDISNDLLFTKIPYMKGALFLRSVANEIGAAKLDDALGSFYKAYAGEATRMSVLVDHIGEVTGFDAWPLAKSWLQTKGIPAG